MVRNAEPDGGFRVNRFDGFRKAFESVNAGDKDVLHAAGFQFRDDL